MSNRMTVADLRERMLAGDEKVTPTELAKAKAAEDFAVFEAEAAAAREEREREAERQRLIAELRVDVDAFLASKGAALQTAFVQHIESGRLLRDLLRQYKSERPALATRRRDLGATSEDVPIPMAHRDDFIDSKRTQLLRTSEEITFNVMRDEPGR